MYDQIGEHATHIRYALETVLATIGVPYRIATPGDPLPPYACVELRVVENELGNGTSASAPNTQYPAPRSSLITHHSSLDQAFRHLARCEEYEVASRDKYGRFLWEHTSMPTGETAGRPLVSEFATKLLSDLTREAKQAGVPLIRKELWPDARPMAACLTHDVDALRRGKLPRGIAVRDVRSAAAAAFTGRLGEGARRAGDLVRTATGPNPYWSFDRISALEREHSFPSTYFVMAGQTHPEDAPYDPAEPRMRALMRKLVDSGCEIALHGSFGTFADAVALKAHKLKLESILASQITGHRNHVLRFRLPDSWRAHQRAGFSYDATLGFADREGYRGCHAFPFRPYDLEADHSLDLLEIPLTVMDVTLHKYRRLRGDQAWGAVTKVLEETRQVGGLATLLWHNDTFYDPDYPGCGRLYEQALSWLSERGTWVATCAEVDRWWRAREDVKIELLTDSRTGWRIEMPRRMEGLALRVSLPDPATPLQAQGPAVCDITRLGPDYSVRLGQIASGDHLDLYW